MYALVSLFGEDKVSGSHVAYERQAAIARNMHLEHNARKLGKRSGAAQEIDENKELLMTLRHALDEAISNRDFEEIEAVRAQIDALQRKSAGLRLHLGASMQRRRGSNSSSSSDSLEVTEDSEAL
mmetsp:Transcript_30115/g.65076  ORF Transcript_30115/g.65076 Transcript_30115/m.65076 type:complete len:125 (-) Transcript_30115:189-563(-)|eukprot:CAMPEP_0206447634 /NCGR_PEP_ID=MMETSP0324_2-20121206/16939_1 /ASSEMBLY_ACC=CAM_ASM_000836 /TAXON_ID=2866 /ORGANISM="Crypthecodinium cohnii, Strain Seligo" /LENGTH=124 /DNA_ID=CAMNT_0053916515 /DNA_START=226 /DNA_END=600 /DNA_ORIENTATION=-